jgi:glycine C-acetyltransferase/8-amino-7-oxononanoate synthase
MRMVSGPQGPRVVLDGRPVLLLCSNNYLGLADHPRVREAAADAAMRWGAGAGAARTVSGTMTLHRRLEERLAEFCATDTALLFGSSYLAGIGVVPALARKGEVVFADSLDHASLADGCRLAGASASPMTTETWSTFAGGSARPTAVARSSSRTACSAWTATSRRSSRSWSSPAASTSA